MKYREPLEVQTETRPHVAIMGTRGYPSYYGGFETAVRNLAPFLIDRGWRVTVFGRPGAVVQNDPDVDPRVASVLTRGIDRKSVSTLSFGLTAALSIARLKPDVALVMNVANGFYLRYLRGAGIPTVVNVDGMEWQREKWGRVGRAVFRRGAQLTAKHADELVYDSVEIESRWGQLFNRTGTYIPYGGTMAKSPLPVEDGLTAGDYLLAVARLVPENSVREFIDASRRLISTTTVVLVGASGYGGPMEQAARELAAQSTRFHWLGHISDDHRLSALWQNAGVYYHGHSVGGTNPALVQAMALGVPTVALDTPFNREVLADAGVYVPPDPTRIAFEVEQLMKDSGRRAAMRTAAITRATERFSWDRVCDDYERLLRKATSQYGGGNI